MKTYRLGHACDRSGNPLFRAVTLAEEDRRKLTVWYLAHQRGRKQARAAFGAVNFEWDGTDRKPIADFPVTSDPLGIWSVRATSVLGELLGKCGDLHPVLVERQPDRYEMFDCWQRVDATPNAGFSAFSGEPLRSLSVKAEVVLPDIFLVSISIGLMVSDRFKTTAEKAELTGMAFAEVDVLRS